MNRILFPLIAFMIMLAGCTSGPDEASIEIEDPWARPGQMKMASEASGEMDPGDMDHGDMEPGEMDMGMGGAGTGAIFMTIRNEGRQADRLVAVSGDMAEFVEMHTTETRDGVTMMAQVEGIDVPARGEVVLEPGGFHIMLINLNRDLNEGDTVQVTLEFENSGTRMLEAQVRAP